LPESKTFPSLFEKFYHQKIVDSINLTCIFLFQNLLSKENYNFKMATSKP